MKTLLNTWKKYRNTFIIVLVARLFTYLLEDVVLGEEYFPIGLELGLVFVEQFKPTLIKWGKSIFSQF